MKHAVGSAAQFIGVKKGTLDNWRSKGIGPAYHKVGSKVVYDESDLQAWLAQCRRTSTAKQVVSVTTR